MGRAYNVRLTLFTTRRRARRAPAWAAAIVVAIIAMTGERALAHDDLAGQIAVLTVLINQSPDSPELLLRRADLYRANRQWNESLADVDRATRLDPTVPARDLVRAQLFFDSGKWQAAIDAASTFLERQPSQPVARLIRGRAFAKLGRTRPAEDDLSVSLAVRPLPDVYLERAHVLARAGDDGLDRAVRSLDEAITRLGPIVTLELEASDIEVRLRRFDAALSRVDRVAAQASRQDSWIARRGAILEKAGRLDQALAAYRQALQLARGPAPSGRPSRATLALASQLESDIARLESTAPSQRLSHR